MSIRFTVDTSQVDRELRRLGDEPDIAVKLLFQAAVDYQLELTKGQVHIDTASLLRSGRSHADFGARLWHGEVSFGGASAGSVHDPVKYAKVELNRGGQHYFFEAVEAGAGRERYIDAIRAHFEGA